MYVLDFYHLGQLQQRQPLSKSPFKPVHEALVSTSTPCTDTKPCKNGIGASAQMKFTGTRGQTPALPSTSTPPNLLELHPHGLCLGQPRSRHSDLGRVQRREGSGSLCLSSRYPAGVPSDDDSPIGFEPPDEARGLTSASSRVGLSRPSVHHKNPGELGLTTSSLEQSLGQPAQETACGFL